MKKINWHLSLVVECQRLHRNARPEWNLIQFSKSGQQWTWRHQHHLPVSLQFLRNIEIHGIPMAAHGLKIFYRFSHCESNWQNFKFFLIFNKYTFHLEILNVLLITECRYPNGRYDKNFVIEKLLYFHRYFVPNCKSNPRFIFHFPSSYPTVFISTPNL